MNVALLLEHYARIADAPDAIARLRRFALDLAVGGKSTDYSPLPTEMAGLGDLATFVMGQAPPGNSTNTAGEGTVFVKVGEFGSLFPEEIVWTTQPLKFAQEGDVLICVVGATIGKLNLAIDCAIGRSVAAIRPSEKLDQRFLYYSLMPFTLRLREGARGTAQGVISRPDLIGIRLWCPPLDEQRRIVAKVEELMALCDQLEAARAEREAARDTFTLSTLAKLNTPDPETFGGEARFALANLTPLTTRPDQIKQLRQTILNLAVRGKLVEQDPSDKPASDLLEQIATNRVRLVKMGELRREKPFEPIKATELPFDLPKGWSWARLGSLIHLISGQHLQPNEYSETANDGLPYITGPSDFGSKGLQISRFALVRKAVAKRGQLLLTVKGSGVGKTTTCNIPEVAISRQLMALTAIEWDRQFLVLVTHRLAEALQASARSLIPGISREDVEQFVLGLPPLAEQHRIVAKVDELMAVCDRLEACITTGEQTRSRLLEAVLHKALEPA